MPKLFISYRRSASAGHAGRLYDRLIQEYGADSVFLDVEKIPPGETFSSYLLAKIDECDVFLLMLGEGTLDRTINEDDWVRREIAYALQHPTITVVPVLQDGYKMPAPETLPDDIQDITVKNAAFLFHQMFDESVHKIIDNLNELFHVKPSAPPTKPDTSEIPIHVVNTPIIPISSPAETATTGTGTLKIHRVGNMIMYRARAFSIKLDGLEVRQIGNNETIILDVPAGQHTLSVHVDYHSPSESLQVKAGETLAYEINVRNMGLSLTIDRV